MVRAIYKSHTFLKTEGEPMEYLEETVHANTDTDTNLELQQEIHTLKLALSNIQNELSASQEKQKFFHRQCKKNEIKLRNMNAIFAANHRETLEMIIDAFITNGRTALKKISSQIHIQEFDPDNVELLEKLIAYLYHIAQELENIKNQYN